MTAVNLHEWLLSFLVNYIRGMIIAANWIRSPNSECVFDTEEEKRKTPTPTGHSQDSHHFPVTGINTLKYTTNLGTWRRLLVDISEGIYQNVERTIPGVQSHWFGSSHLYIAQLCSRTPWLFFFLKPKLFLFKIKSVLKYNKNYFQQHKR